MKILWFSHFVPFPPVGGAHQRSFNLIRHISRSNEVFLVAFNHHGDTAERISEYKCELEKYCKIVEIWQPPYRRRSFRWWTEFTLNPLFDDPFACRTRWSRQLDAQWEHTIHRFRPDLIHFDSSDLASFAMVANGFRKVLNHHNCESAMVYRRARKEPNPLKKAWLWAEARKLERLEKRICDSFDVNTVVSASDAAILYARNSNSHFHVVENGTDTNYYVPMAGLQEPQSLIFAGSMNWYPNLSAIQFFTREIWPLIKEECPDVCLYLAGKFPPAWLVRQVQGEPNIVLVANPDDMRPWVARATIFVCPIVDGGGTRLKILDAMAMGKAVVSTSVGCEGLRVKHRENILVGDTPKEFASVVVQSLKNESLRNRIGKAGRALVEEHYDWGKIGNCLEQAYLCALDHDSCGHRSVEHNVPGDRDLVRGEK